MGISDDYDYEPPNRPVSHNDIRALNWIMRDGRGIAIGEMSDRHLLNAYKLTSDEDLLKEMIVRLFESRLEARNT